MNKLDIGGFVSLMDIYPKRVALSDPDGVYVSVMRAGKKTISGLSLAVSIGVNVAKAAGMTGGDYIDVKIDMKGRRLLLQKTDIKERGLKLFRPGGGRPRLQITYRPEWRNFVAPIPGPVESDHSIIGSAILIRLK